MKKTKDLARTTKCYEQIAKAAGGVGQPLTQDEAERGVALLGAAAASPAVTERIESTEWPSDFGGTESPTGHRGINQQDPTLDLSPG